MLDTCVLTVAAPMTRSAAISELERPAPMRRSTAALVATATALALAAGAAGCTHSGGCPGPGPGTSTGGVSGPKDRLTVLSAGPLPSWDPQRITSRQTAGFASRTWMRTLTAYAAYYDQWAQPWEVQALLRATHVAGDEDIAREFLHLVDETRYPEGGVSPTTVNELRRIKARVDSERLPRGADPATHTKLGRGGLSDVEWTVQMLQMQHAAAEESLRTTSTVEALAAEATPPDQR